MKNARSPTQRAAGDLLLSRCRLKRQSPVGSLPTGELHRELFMGYAAGERVFFLVSFFLCFKDRAWFKQSSQAALLFASGAVIMLETAAKPFSTRKPGGAA